MVEKGTIYTEIENYGEILGLVVGDESIHQMRVPNIPGTSEFVTSGIKRPVIAIMRDAYGNNYCEQFNTELHGEERELPQIPASALLQDEDFFDVWECVEQALEEGYKRKVMNVEDKWREEGGNPRIRLPKKVYGGGKLR